jgi:release factor glutamine methyltransferase
MRWAPTSGAACSLRRRQREWNDRLWHAGGKQPQPRRRDDRGQAQRHMSVSAGTPVRDALQGATTAFTAAGCETPRLDAEVLLAAVLGVPRERLIIDRPELEVSGDAVHLFREAVRRRAIEREPVAYITGRKGFRALELMVDARVLIPRPETELLVEAALQLPPRARVLDLGSGSGAVALAVKHERPDLEVWGSDVSDPALSVAKANGERLGLKVRWLHSDLLDGVPDEVEAVLSNPPYIAASEAQTLAPEIARHEPPQALLGGEDGLAVIRPLLEQTAARRRIATIALEVGAGQAASVAQMMRDAGFSDVAARRDLAEIDRVVIGRRRARGWSLKR